jgi:hypothetical protein
MRTIGKHVMIGMALAAATALAGPAQAQQGNALNNLVTARTNQNLAGLAVGNGVNQGQPIVDVQPASGRPKIGVGALSGRVDHFGSKGTVSVANNARIVGIDGAGGVRSPNSISVRNPTQQPILSGTAAALGSTPH